MEDWKLNKETENQANNINNMERDNKMVEVVYEDENNTPPVDHNIEMHVSFFFNQT